MSSILIKNARVVNEDIQLNADVFINKGRIERIDPVLSNISADREIDASGKFLLPGMIDDQVHFREPGLTHKATIASESRAAVAGGITSFMEMPNTIPNALTQELLEDKYRIAAASSPANYSFYMGASNDNLEEVLKTNPETVCGVKVFMGSSTGNMLVDEESALEGIFSQVPLLIATHCEDERTIRRNLESYREKFGDDIPVTAHPLIRSAEACYLSSSRAVELAKKHGTRLHILHISTAKETELFDNSIPLKDKKITAEACVHHLWFDDTRYEELGNLIKWNPAIKRPADRKAILEAVISDKIDVIATDHAPHTLEEKSQPYLKAPSGGPLVQHALPALLELYCQHKISLETIVRKTAHNVADCFRIKERGYIREGYMADLVLVDPSQPHTAKKDNLLYKCGWSPFEGYRFSTAITHTFVNGNLVYENGTVHEGNNGHRLEFTSLEKKS
ncbi:dihydroorotase [Anseongella ginsenosidimutans]|uniref:Dihydroorotase n=1 Tax=Anseongella ginsenosidimutans TaxID=496056 RepID=A0A4R3KWK8_9SPHI|nr:dihydroorotase [Anseongella ginsenosidimutans]QEC53422.1 dihydroorotase [Anseongella ginsenosidimutans]TCS88311.1 dihydroorotase [Anseongella ginsenosidimutans]